MDELHFKIRGALEEGILVKQLELFRRRAIIARGNKLNGCTNVWPQIYTNILVEGSVSAELLLVSCKMQFSYVLDLS